MSPRPGEVIFPFGDLISRLTLGVTPGRSWIGAMSEPGTPRRLTLEALRDLMAELASPDPLFTLRVHDHRSELIFYFIRGGVRITASGERTLSDVPSALLATGKIDVEELHEILEGVRVHRANLKELLIQKKIVNRDEFNALCTSLVRDELMQLVRLDVNRAMM